MPGSGAMEVGRLSCLHCTAPSLVERDRTFSVVSAVVEVRMKCCGNTALCERDEEIITEVTFEPCFEE